MSDHDAPTIAGDGVVYEGRRFHVGTSLAGKPYGDGFGVDVGIADVMAGAPDLLTGTDFFERYGISRVVVPVYPLPTHIAEKVHAYSIPRDRPNSRLKDLVDLALLAGLDPDPAAARAAIAQTFAFRASHPPPRRLPDPPEDWVARYPRMRDEERLPWGSLAEVLAAARAGFDAILEGLPPPTGA